MIHHIHPLETYKYRFQGRRKIYFRSNIYDSNVYKLVENTLNNLFPDSKVLWTSSIINFNQISISRALHAQMLWSILLLMIYSRTLERLDTLSHHSFIFVTLYHYSSSALAIFPWYTKNFYPLEHYHSLRAHWLIFHGNIFWWGKNGEIEEELWKLF